MATTETPSPHLVWRAPFVTDRLTMNADCGCVWVGERWSDGREETRKVTTCDLADH